MSKRALHLIIMANVLGMIWMQVFKHGFDIYSTSLAAALLGVHAMNTVMTNDEKNS